MPRLVAKLPTGPKTIPLGDEALTIGRTNDNKLPLDADGVSRKHAQILFVGKGYEVVDLGSRNGTKVNGQRVMDTFLLKEGDMIQIGHTMLVFTEIDFEDEQQSQEFVEKAKRRVSTTLDTIAEREQYTEAATIFAKIFRKRA